jgi:hypothetical protein
MSDNIKVIQNDGSRQTVDIKKVKPIHNIKVIRPQEPEYSSSEDSMSSVSSEPESEIRPKKTKKILRRKESNYNESKNYSMFTNPKKMSSSHRHAPSQSEDNYSESEYSSGNSISDDNESFDAESEINEKESYEEKQRLKQDLLIKIQALEKKGFEFSKKFNMTSSYSEMEFEYNKIKKYIETQAGIKFARRCLMACVTGIEFLNKRFDPFNIKLEGWSENVMESVDDYDNVFEKLHEKYSSKSEVSPEIELLLMLGGSAFMFHLTNTLLKGPSIGNMVAQNNPNFMASMMGAMNQGMKDMKPPNFQQNGATQSQNSGPPKPMETRGIRKEMNGPSMDPNLFHGTPLANNYPKPPGYMPPPPNASQLNRMYEEHMMDDNDDRVSVVSTDSSLSSVSVGSTVKKVNMLKKSGGKKGGFELNIN